MSMTHYEAPRLMMSSAVAELGGTSSIYLSQIRNKAKDAKTGRPREMGSAMARKLEEGAGKAWGWMDTWNGQPEESPKDQGRIDEAELIAASRALSNDEASRRLLLDMAKRLALTSGDSLGGAALRAPARARRKRARREVCRSTLQPTMGGIYTPKGGPSSKQGRGRLHPPILGALPS